MLAHACHHPSTALLQPDGVSPATLLHDQGPDIFMTVGTKDVTATSAASIMASLCCVAFSNYPVCVPGEGSHMWASRSWVAFLKQLEESFPGATLLCMTGESFSLAHRQRCVTGAHITGLQDNPHASLLLYMQFVITTVLCISCCLLHRRAE